MGGSGVKTGITVYCTYCDLRKTPIGRSGPLGMALCDFECPGYRVHPYPGSLWPGETEGEFSYPVGDDGVEDI